MNNKDSRWRQPTPLMQLIALTGSMEGHKCNHTEGIISDSYYCRQLDDHVDQLVNLQPFIKQGKW